MADTKKQDMSIPDWPIDEELIATATAVLQAHERLSFLMRTKLQENISAKTAIDDSNTILDSLRHLKSRIEGTQFIFQPLSLDHDQLVLLKHLVVAHTPENLQEQTKIKIVEKLNTIFKGQVKRIVYACILTCPWFARAQSEVSGQAKNNILFVVYVGRDEQFFSLATQHEKELCETWDEPPIFACEVRHFCAQLQRGNVRCVEALCSPSESLILSSPEWSSLTTLIDPVALLHRTFIDRCIGQAMGALVKKRPAVSGRLVVRDDATLTKFCDSFRLLSYAESAIKRVPLSSWHDVGRNEEETEIISALNDAFEGLIHKEKLLQYIIKIKERVEEKIEDVPRIPPQWSEQLGEWLTKIRMDGVKISPQAQGLFKYGVSFSDISPSLSDDPLRGFLDSQGLTTLHSRDVIVIAKGGSMMYNLALPTSDIDYIVVYREPTERIISSSVNLKESIDNKGHKAETEMAAYEIRLFCEMLIKGAVNMFEMLFAEQLDYTSDYWKQLIAHKTSFMSEKVVLQYLGFVKTHMKMIEARKHEGTPRERKFFYQVFHKLLSLESYVQGGPPVVTCKDEDREYILQVRRGPLEGPLARDTLYAEAERRIAEVREKLMKREKRYQEFGDYRILQTWLLSVRGISLKEPLKMATPPLV